MSLERKDIFTDEAIGSPLIMAENFELLAESVEKLLNLLKQSGQNIKAADSTAKLAKETETLTLAQVEQEKITKQLAVAQARQATEYQATKKQITELNKEIKTKNELGDIDAKTVTRQNASLKQLEAALAKNREARARLTTEEERSSKTGLELLAIIQSQDKAVKDLKGEMGQHQDKVGDYAGAMKGLKDEFKAARDEMVVMASKFGTESQEFLKAAERAGQLKDEIDDAQKSIKNVAGSKLENLSATFGDVFSKLKSGDLKGSIESAKQFAVVSKTITFKEAAESVKQFGQTLGIVGRAILTNPLFLLAGVLVGIALAWKKLSDQADDFHRRTLENMDEASAAITKRYAFERRQLEIQKKETFDLRKEEQESIIKDAQSTMGKLEDMRDDLTSKFGVSKFAFGLFGSAILSEEEFNKKFDGLRDAVESANQELVLIELERQQFIKEQNDAAFKELMDKKREEAKIQADADKAAKAALKKHEEEMAQIRFEAANYLAMKKLEEFEAEIAQANKEYKLKQEIGVEAAKLSKQIRDKEAADRKADNDKKLSDEKALQDALLKLREQAFQTANDLIANNFEAEQIELDARKNRLETQQAAELTAAGNNADAKAAIEAKYAEKIKAIENEQRAVKRKQAIADKAMAAFQIGVNTARAITQVLPNIPLSIIMGALGALQLAAVLTKPIPAFERGVKAGVFKGGAAIVGERGRELINTNQGSFLSPDKATLVNLPKGAEVVTHKETMRRLAAAGIAGERFNNRQVGSVIPMDELLAEQRNSTTEITKAIRSTNSELYLQGSILMKKQKISDTYTKKMMAKHGL